MLFLPDIQFVLCRCFLGTYTSEHQVLPQSLHTRLEILVTPERKRANSLGANCERQRRSKTYYMDKNQEIEWLRYLGMAQIATNKFQLWNRNQPRLISTSNGIINQAIAETTMCTGIETKLFQLNDEGKIGECLLGNAIIPTVQNISIQHKIFSLYFVGWNSP